MHGLTLVSYNDCRTAIYLLPQPFCASGVRLLVAVRFVFLLLVQVVVSTTAGTSRGIYHRCLYRSTMAPVERATLNEEDATLYDAFSAWLCRVDAHTTRSTERTKLVLDSIWKGDARSFHGIAGMCQH